MISPVGNASLTRFDVLIIGSGAGGAPVAQLLAEHGQKVLILEAGANWFEHLDDPAQQPVTRFSNDELKLKARRFIEPNSLVEPRTFRTSEKDGARIFVGDVNPLPKTVGGGGVHADWKAPRFLEFDFQLGTLLGDVSGASFADWPVDYSMLESFYAYAEKVMGVQGVAGANPFEGPRSTPFPMPPSAPMYLANLVSDGCRSLGYTAFSYPAALNSIPYAGRPECVQCGFCSGYGCPTNAKGTPAVTCLRRALLTGNALLWPETRATRLVMNDAGTEVVGVDALDPEGNPVRFTADRYVLAASPIEDARLLFQSRDGGVGNSSGLVGRNLMFHLQNIAIGIFEQRLHPQRGRTVSHGFSDFRGVPNDPNRPLGGIVEIGGSDGPIREAGDVLGLTSILGFNGSTFKKLLRQSPFRDRLVSLTMQAEDAPQLTNRVDLDPDFKDLDGLPVARVTYASHPFELSAREFYGPKMVELLGASGARYAAVAPMDAISGSAHIMGTLRFGNDSKTSVCDATGKFHDVGNLYASDGSLFPTSTGYNPSFTIVSLAMRVAGEMLFPGSPERALT